MPSVQTYRVYRWHSPWGKPSYREFKGIVSVPLNTPNPERVAIEIAKGLYGYDPHKHGSDYSVEMQGID